jgi:GNAT superfamily N-acetyltransferase
VSLHENRANNATGSADDRASTRVLIPVIQCLRHTDENQFQRLWLELEPAARIARFDQTWDGALLSSHAQAALTNADWVFGAFVDGCLRGAVEVYCNRVNGDAEAAIVVEQAWRRRGIGMALLHASMRTAAKAKATALKMTFSRHNWAMRRLSRKAGGRIDVVFDSLSVEIDLRSLRGSETSLI